MKITMSDKVFQWYKEELIFNLMEILLDFMSDTVVLIRLLKDSL